VDRGRIEEAHRNRGGWRNASASIGGLEAQHGNLPKSSSGNGDAFCADTYQAKEFLGKTCCG